MKIANRSLGHNIKAAPTDSKYNRWQLCIGSDVHLVSYKSTIQCHITPKKKATSQKTLSHFLFPIKRDQIRKLARTFNGRNCNNLHPPLKLTETVATLLLNQHRDRNSTKNETNTEKFHEEHQEGEDRGGVSCHSLNHKTCNERDRTSAEQRRSRRARRRRQRTSSRFLIAKPSCSQNLIPFPHAVSPSLSR